MGGLANVSIDTTDPLNPRVLVNGEPVDGVSRVTLDCVAGTVPTLYIERPVEAGVIEGPGVTVAQRPTGEPEIQDVLQQFFDRLDPSEVERAMLEEDVETTGQAAIAVFKRWVSRG
jgi:hypothetical protein